MKNKIQTTGWMLSVSLTLLLLSSCTKKDDIKSIDNKALIGTWADTITVSPNGYYVYELILDNNSSFTEKSNAYGTYEGQNDKELSGWYERTGNYELNESKVSFNAEKTVSWDSFSGGDPVTTIKTQVIFEDCTFSINNNTLELKYTTYPADAPEITIRKYTKRNS